MSSENKKQLGSGSRLIIDGDTETPESTPETEFEKKKLDEAALPLISTMKRNGCGDGLDQPPQ